MFLLCTALALLAVAAPAAITDEKIRAAAAEPAAIVSLLSTAPEDQITGIVGRVIAAIETSDVTEAQKKERIAQVVSEATRWADDRAPVVIAPVVGQISAPWQRVFAAAATMAAGPTSPAMLAAMINAVAQQPGAAQAIRQAARAPAATLSAALRATSPSSTAPAAPAPAVPAAGLSSAKSAARTGTVVGVMSSLSKTKPPRPSLAPDREQ